jgi:uncharacterized protein
MARYRMYQVVYFHKTTRAAEVMLRLLFKRYRDLLEASEDSPPFPDAPPALRRVFLAKGSAALQDYLELDDHTVTEFLKAAVRSGDPLLESLASGLLDRVLYKATDVSGIDYHDEQRFRKAAEAKVLDSGMDVEYAFVSDRPADTPYKPYDPASGKPPSLIYVEGSDGRPHEISHLSRLVAELMDRVTLVRYYYPESLRGAIRPLAEDILRSTR